MLKGCLAVMGEVDGFMFAFGLTLFAGLATGVGSLLAFFSHLIRIPNFFCRGR